MNLTERAITAAWREVSERLLINAYQLPKSVADDISGRVFTDDYFEVADQLVELLMRKNAEYGNSALSPVRHFSRSSPVEQLRVRADDKISRLMYGTASTEDSVMDLLGYLILLEIAETEAVKAEADAREACLTLNGTRGLP